MMTSVPPIAHWDEVEPKGGEVGHLAGRWSDLGTAAGSVTVGVQRIEVPAGRWSTPAHAEGIEEEIFYVLEGSGLSWQDGEVYEVGPGDCLVHLSEGEAHTLRAGTDELVVLAFGQRANATMTHLPRPGIAWLGRTWVEVGRGGHPFEQEAAVGEPEVGEPSPRPPRIVATADVPGQERGRALVRDLGRAAGSLRTGLRHTVLPPGAEGAPPHCHSAEEEIFVVLDGEGVCILGEDEHPVRRGHVVARPPGTGIAHSFRAGPSGLTYLAYGTREPNDIVYYPRERKVRLRGIGVVLEAPPQDA